MKYYAQTKQDFIIDKLFGQKENGIFLDIGAYDGITLSNTYFFEKTRNWNGLCMEPLPEKFEVLKDNRNCKLINGAISETSETLEFCRVYGASEMLSGINKYRDPRHKERTTLEISLYGGNVKMIKVQGYTFDDIISKFHLKQIDYLSLDIEGGELEVLQTIDFDKTNITILTVENNYKNRELKELMYRKGYYLIFKYAADEFYIKKNFLIVCLRKIFTNWYLVKLFFHFHIRSLYRSIKKRV